MNVFLIFFVLNMYSWLRRNALFLELKYKSFRYKIEYMNRNDFIAIVYVG